MPSAQSVVQSCNGCLVDIVFAGSIASSMPMLDSVSNSQLPRWARSGGQRYTEREPVQGKLPESLAALLTNGIELWTIVCGKGQLYFMPADITNRQTNISSKWKTRGAKPLQMFGKTAS